MLCNMCPRKCNVERDRSCGACGTSNEITVARAMRHYWEEPCISGKKGSGAIFFSGCNLKCIYCQNYAISRGEVGKRLSNTEFQTLVQNTAKAGVDNINLVTPTHFTKQIVSALSEIKSEINVPIVWNSSGYETPESIEALDGIVDIFLCDVKYYDNATAKEYSNAPEYFDVTLKALEKMLSIAPHPKFREDGMLESGVIVRHLVLPSTKTDSEKILESLAKYKDNIILSLMCQYTPTDNVKDHKKLKRRLTTLEYSYVVDVAKRIGFKGYIQDKASAMAEYTPDFGEKWDFSC